MLPYWPHPDRRCDLAAVTSYLGKICRQENIDLLVFLYTSRDHKPISYVVCYIEYRGQKIKNNAALQDNTSS